MQNNKSMIKKKGRKDNTWKNKDITGEKNIKRKKCADMTALKQN